jgi:hypothetical protein
VIGDELFVCSWDVAFLAALFLYYRSRWHGKYRILRSCAILSYGCFRRLKKAADVEQLYRTFTLIGMVNSRVTNHRLFEEIL